MRIGTRGSALALAQARLVAGLVEAHLAAAPMPTPIPVELVTIATAGDRDSAAEEAGSGSRHPVDEGLLAGGDKSRWVNELERAWARAACAAPHSCEPRARTWRW